MTSDDALRTAVTSSRTFTEAAKRLGLPYEEVYRRAKKLRARTLTEAEREKRREDSRAAYKPSSLLDVREPVPESEPVRLSAWIEPSEEHRASYKANVVLVRVDQHGRVRAQIMDRGEHFVAWCVRDSTGTVVGKMGLCPAISYEKAVQLGKEGADAALLQYGWLRHRRETPHACTTSTALCTPAIVIPDDNTLRQKAEALLAAPRAQRVDLGVELARMILAQISTGHRSL